MNVYTGKSARFSRSYLRGTCLKILISSDLDMSTVNGIRTSVLNLKRGLEKRGHDVRILTLSRNHRASLQNKIYSLGSFSLDFIYPDLRWALPGNKKLVQELLKWNPDVIHTQMEGSTFFYARYISRKTKAPLIHTYHTVYEKYFHYFPPAYLLGEPGVYRVLNLLCSSCSAFIVPSRKIYAAMKRNGIKKPVKVIPTGIDFDAFLGDYKKERTAIRKHYGISENECVLLYVGRTVMEKNIEELISFVSSKELKNIRLIVAGSGRHLNTLKRLGRNSAYPERFIFTGLIAPKNIPALYHSADIFVSSSVSETQGLTYMEAMASSLLLLCRNDRSLKDFIRNGENGFVYKNREEFIRYITLLSNDPSKRSEITENALVTVKQKYSLDTFASSAEKIYLKCIAGR